VDKYVSVQPSAISYVPIILKYNRHLVKMMVGIIHELSLQGFGSYADLIITRCLKKKTDADYRTEMPAIQIHPCYSYY
jgi:hypothetical protein